MKNKIINGNSLEELKKLKEKSVNMCMTSPPYWALRDYGDGNSKIWGGEIDCKHNWIENIQPQRGGKNKKDNMPSVGSNKYLQESNSMGYGNPIKSDFCSKCGAWKGQLGLEPTFEQYISNLCDIFDEVKRVLRDDGTCWVNLGDTYYGGGNNRGNNSPISKKQASNKGATGQVQQDWSKMNYQSKCLTMIPERFAIEMVNRGWILRNKIIWHKKNCMPCSVKDRFTVDFEYLFFFSKKKRYYFETQYEPVQQSSIERMGRKWEGSKHNKLGVKNNMQQEIKPEERMNKDRWCNDKGRNKRTTWTINTRNYSEAHFAVYPEELCETPIKAGCPEGGVVLDPFFGAGTTGLVALKQNKKFIGIELNKEYIEIIKRRLTPYMEQTKLDANVPLNEK